MSPHPSRGRTTFFEAKTLFEEKPQRNLPDLGEERAGNTVIFRRFPKFRYISLTAVVGKGIPSPSPKELQFCKFPLEPQVGNYS